MPGKTNYLGMPNNRVLIFCPSETRKELEAIVNSDGNARISGELLNHVRQVESNPGWAVGTIPGKLKEKLGQIQAADLGPFVFLQPALSPLKNSKLISGTVGFSGKNMKFSLSVTCGNDADAGSLKNTLGLVKLSLNLIPAFLPKDAGKLATSLTNDLSKSFKVESQGPVASASLEISPATLEEVKTVLQGSVQKVHESAGHQISDAQP